MITSLILRNFQSHKKTFLEFHPNVNVIIGSSNSGKTAILRGLFWAINNRPSGLAFISNWNRDKKGSPVKQTSVGIGKDKFAIFRVRSSELNGYKIGDVDGTDETLEAIGMDVPEQITKLLNLSDVNIQKQMDAPFLLSESASEVARFLNREIRLDLIDRILSGAEAKRRKFNQDIKLLDVEINNINKELESFINLDEAEKWNGKLILIEKQIEEMEEQLEDLNNLVSEYGKYSTILDKYKHINFKEIETVISDLDKLKIEEKKLIENKNALEILESDYKFQSKAIIENNKVMVDSQKLLPKSCPLCNQPLPVNGGKL